MQRESIKDTRPVVLIPAYKPLDVVVEVASRALASDVFQAVICVDDGSGPAFRPIFDALAEQGAVVLRHAVNLGKGMALRTGLNHIAGVYPDAVGAVTADADGQHLLDDVVAVGKALITTPRSLVLGVRTFDAQKIPLRSRIGNTITRHVVRFLVGIDTPDTQTGLRGIPQTLMPQLLRLTTRGYDFELEMLVVAKSSGTTISQVPIRTVYIDDNASSHFRPLRDSLAIYFVLIRYCANSIVTSLIDYAVFAILIGVGYPIFASMVGGRLAAGGFNFTIGRFLVFKSRGNAWGELLRYVALVIALMLIAYVAISYLVSTWGVPAIAAKIGVEGTLFLVSFAAQRILVFPVEP